MAKTKFKSVDEYIALQPDAVWNVLQRVRSTIREAVPGAHEVISCQIPTYELRGGPVLDPFPETRQRAGSEEVIACLER